MSCWPGAGHADAAGHRGSSQSLCCGCGPAFVHISWTGWRRKASPRLSFCIGYRGEMIREYVGDGGRWGLGAVYVTKGSHLKGTGGALRLALDQGVLDPAFAVLYGDSFF